MLFSTYSTSNIGGISMKKRKDGRWLKVIVIEGTRLYFYSSKKTEKQAEKDINRQILEYTQKEEKGRMFKDVADEWYEQHMPTLETQTIISYQSPYNYCLEVFGDEYIKNIKPQDIQLAIDRKACKGFALKTMRNQLSVFSLIFKFACLKSYIESNPCEYIKIPKNLKKSKRLIPDDEQIEKVKSSVLYSDMGLFAYLILYTGLRKGEALALNYEDIDFHNKCIRVTKSVYHDSNMPYIKQPKTDAGIREVILFDCLAEKLKGLKPRGLIFTGKDGGLMKKSTFKVRWKKYQEDNGITITPHQLRHAYASYILFDAGIDAKAAQVLMGHSDISTTQNIYTQITEAHKQSTYSKLNEYIKKFNE